MAIETFMGLARAAGHKALPIERKGAGFRDEAAAEWLRRNGFYRLAESRGYGGIPTQDRALQCGAFYGCVKIIGEDMGALPIALYEKLRDDSRREVADHPVNEALHFPNPEMTGTEFREAITAHACFGDGYAQIVRGRFGRIFLWLLMPYDVRTDRDQNEELFYWVRQRNGQEKAFPKEEIFHLKGFTLTGIHGVNLLQIAKDIIGLSLDQTEYAKAFFNRDHTPGITLVHPQGIGPEATQAIKEAYVRDVQSHGVAALAEDIKVIKTGQSNVESQLTEQRAEQVLEVARLLRMPPHKLGYLREGASYASIEQRNIEYYTETLHPWVKRWKDAISLRLLQPGERRRYYAEHSIEEFLRGDFKTQADSFARFLEKGVYSINEVRKMFNLSPIPGGDEHFIQLNLGTIDHVANPPEKTALVRVGK
jgi:HK97 family phage portal protein